MLRVYTSDLHIHSCLSPCADLEMAPKDIVRRAAEEGLDIISITDHNSGKNVEAVIQAAEGSPVSIFPGMEVQTIEEVHILTFFKDLNALREWDEIVYEGLPDVPNNPDYFGDQPIVNMEGEILGFEEKLLLNSVQMTVDQVFKEVERWGGYCLPAHVDRGSFGLIGQLGFIPSNLNIVAVEVHDLHRADQLTELKGLRFITSSDAHFLSEVGGRRSDLLMEGVSFSELKMALEGRKGREIVSLR
ncbi:MAG: PHP domain-containing protein [Deltaproteobacteria bacterium]|nr:PHP domain-containing protein [Deltaproteobacteria bacterium]